MRVLIPFLLLMLLILLLPPDRTATNDFNLLAAVTQKLQAENSEEPDIPFVEKFAEYPPANWAMYSGAAFWKTINVINPRLLTDDSIPPVAATLAGLSTWSFRFQFSKAWMPSATDPFCGYNCAEYILPKAGYETEIFYNSSFRFVEKTQDKNFIDHAEFSTKITNSFGDKNITVTGTIFPHPDYAVLEGVEKAAKKIEMPRDRKFPSPWVMIRFESWHNTDISNLYKKSLILADQINNTDRIGHYASGRNAFQEWIDALEKIDSIYSETDLMSRACFTNSWIYHSLIEARVMAREYLIKNIDLFQVDKQLIMDLSDIYDKEIKLLQDDKINILPLSQCREFDQWTNQMRKNQIATLQALIMQEEEASKIMKGLN